jgi:small redox-active disulfide protein 2
MNRQAMKHIKILGTGCAKCKKTEEIVRQVIASDRIDATVEKVEDIQAIMAYNVLTTPVLVIDEKVMSKGRVPTAEEVRTMLIA